jgi:hypothetical protein
VYARRFGEQTNNDARWHVAAQHGARPDLAIVELAIAIVVQTRVDDRTAMCAVRLAGGIGADQNRRRRFGRRRCVNLRHHPIAARAEHRHCGHKTPHVVPGHHCLSSQEQRSIAGIVRAPMLGATPDSSIGFI